MKLQKFIVEKLHDNKSYELHFEDNLLILVSGNGFGKTTLVNLFYYFISRQWNKLIDYNVSKLTLLINDEAFELSSDVFRKFAEQDTNLTRRFSKNTTIQLEEISRKIDSSNLMNINHYDLEILSQEHKIPSRLIRDYIYELQEKRNSIEKHNAIKYIEKKLNTILEQIQFIYLPTYRRIEKDFQNIFPHLEDSIREMRLYNRRNGRRNSETHFLELVEFGMNDVLNKIDNRCEELKDSFYSKLNGDLIASYLNDIINRNYSNLEKEKIEEIDSTKLNNILKRLDNSIINKEGKENLRIFVNTLKENTKLEVKDQISAHFVFKLINIYNLQQKEEEDINLLINTCNKYLGKDKEMYFSQIDYKVSIISKKDFNIPENDKKNTIEFKDLSSGEKQLISLFTHLILNQKDFFLIIDEPELSLSVPWQEDLLPNILSLKNCTGLLAVTHSPFIFKNGLRKYTHSLEEFNY